jgi:hypothetical protein
MIFLRTTGHYRTAIAPDFYMSTLMMLQHFVDMFMEWYDSKYHELEIYKIWGNGPSCRPLASYIFERYKVAGVWALYLRGTSYALMGSQKSQETDQYWTRNVWLSE